MAKNTNRKAKNAEVRATSFIDTFREHSAAVVADLEAQREAPLVANMQSELTDEPIAITVTETNEPPISPELLAEIAEADASEMTIIDHHTQRGSWTAPTLTDDELADLEIAEAKHEAIADLARALVVEALAEQPADPEQPDDFAAKIAAISQEDAIAKSVLIAKQIDDRVAFQKTKNPDNTSILKTLDSARKELIRTAAAKLLMATNVDEAFINRQLHDGSRYNVYAFGKIADLARALVDGAGLNNAINKAVVRSMFNCKRNGVTFTLEVAKAAASDKIRIDPSLSKHLFRHTVSASTAPTQASSTMQALETLGVVRIDGSRRNPVYIVNDNPVARALETVASAVAAA
jgi:hypothetical protein